MRRSVACVVAFAVVLAVSGGKPLRAGEAPAPPWLDAYREPAARLIGEALGSTFAWNRLALLTDTIGNRLSGTPQLARAIAWAADEMRRDGLENVHTEKAMVPHWVRGAEQASIVEPARHRIAMLGLGGSVATPPEGLDAEVLSVQSFDDLEAHAAEAHGRIVLFNAPYVSYGETVRYRAAGASRAARYGAVAALVRSVGLPGGCGRRIPAHSSTPTTPRRSPRRQSPSKTPTGSSG